jgi:hypothetical protein
MLDLIQNPQCPILGKGQYPATILNVALLHVITLLNSALSVTIDGLVYVDQTEILTQLFLVYAAYYHFGGKEVVTLFLITLEQNHIHLDEAGRHFKYAGLNIVRHESSRRAPIGWRMEAGECVTFIGYLVRMRTDVRSTAATNRQRRSLKRKAAFAPCPVFQQQVSIFQDCTSLLFHIPEKQGTFFYVRSDSCVGKLKS